MDTQRKYTGHPAHGQEGRPGRVQNIGLPLPYEGVGRALRKTFGHCRGDLPDDMLDLIDQLNRL